MLVTSFFKITGFHLFFGCTALCTAYVGYPYLDNYWITLNLWVSNLNLSLCSLVLPTETVGYTTLIGVQPHGQPMSVRSTYRINGLHLFYCRQSL